MRTGFCRTTLGLIVAGLVGINGSVLHAQTFPSRPVKAITDVGTGGTYDIFVRALGERLQQRWGQGFVVEPHPGGNAIIGNRACATSPPPLNGMETRSVPCFLLNRSKNKRWKMPGTT